MAKGQIWSAKQMLNQSLKVNPHFIRAKKERSRFGLEWSATFFEPIGAEPNMENERLILKVYHPQKMGIGEFVYRIEQPWDLT